MKTPTGIHGLDTMLKGGLFRGRNILLSGPCGSGKTTLAMQFLYNGVMMYGDSCLYVTLEEAKDKIYNDMMEFGMDLERAEKSGKFIMIGGPIARLKSYMEKFDTNVKYMIKEIEEVVKKYKIKRVVIDSVNLLTMLLNSDEERRKTLASLSNTLSSLGCISFFLSETEEGKMNLSRYGIEEFVVDGVIVLYLMRKGSLFVPGIVVRKMRGTDHDKNIRYYQITNNGIVVYPEESMFNDM